MFQGDPGTRQKQVRVKVARFPDFVGRPGSQKLVANPRAKMVTLEERVTEVFEIVSRNPVARHFAANNGEVP